MKLVAILPIFIGSISYIVIYDQSLLWWKFGLSSLHKYFVFLILISVLNRWWMTAILVNGSRDDLFYSWSPYYILIYDQHSLSWKFGLSIISNIHFVVLILISIQNRKWMTAILKIAAILFFQSGSLCYILIYDQNLQSWKFDLSFMSNIQFMVLILISVWNR